MKKVWRRKNIVNVVFTGLIIILLFVPSAKAAVLQGLMRIGLFEPDTTSVEKNDGAAESLSGIRFKDVSGKVVDLGDLKGKIIFINFWASWCPPCLAEMPAINKLYEKFKNEADYVFIFVDADSNLIKAQKFMDRRKYGLPVYAVASEIPEMLFEGTLPTTVVFDKQGRISYKASGVADYNSNKFSAFMTKLRNTK
jgi:thiol-disulfide isomerase/thioredoxin